MNNNEDEANKLLQEIRYNIIDFTTQNFFSKVVLKYQNQEQMCFNQNKENSLGFVKCMKDFQKRQIKEEKKMEFKINYIKNDIVECLNVKQRKECQEIAINNIINVQSEFLQSLL